MSNLYEFIKTKIVKKDEDRATTHTIMADFGKIYKCKFYLWSQDFEEFYDLYETELKKKSQLGIIEQHRHLSPILIDLDFRYNEPDRKYKSTDVIDFVEKLITIIRTFVEINNDQLPVYILEKPAPKASGDKYKDGIHIVIPEIVTKPDIQYAIRDEFLKQHPKYFASLSTSSDSDVFDKDVIEKNGWLMYGSKKQDDKHPWYLSNILYMSLDNRVVNDEQINDKKCQRIDLVKLFSIRNKFTESKIIKHIIIHEPPAQNDDRISVGTSSTQSSSSMPQDIAFAMQIVDILSPSRAENYASWMAVGWCLFNIYQLPFDDVKSPTSGLLLDKWKEFSKLSAKYKQGECERLWLNMDYDANGYKIGSLITWGREDAPDIMQKLELQFKCSDSIDGIRTNKYGPSFSYTAVKHAFEKEVIMITNPETLYLQHCDSKVIINDKRGIREKYDFLKCTVWKGKNYERSKFLDLWFNDYNMRYFKWCGFLPPPQECPANVYNMWPGFKIDQLDVPSSNNIQPFLDHISVLTNHDEADMDFFIKWLAQMIQQPGVKKGIAVIIVSKEGTGKNLFLNGIEDMIGSSLYHETANPKSTLFDRFSNGRLNKLLINIDEAQMRDTFQFQQELKNMITSETLNFEKKGKDPVTVQDFCRIILTSNNSLVVKLEPNSRRYVVFEASSEKIGDAAYFNSLYSYMKDRSNQKAIIEYLRSIDISQVNWQTGKPKNEAYLNMMQQCVDPVLRFLEHIYINDLSDIDATNHVERSSNVLTRFKIFLRSDMNMADNIVNAWNQTKFGIKLNDYIKEAPDAIIKKKNIGREFTRCYIFEKEGLKKLLTKYFLLRDVSYMFVD